MLIDFRISKKRDQNLKFSVVEFLKKFAISTCYIEDMMLAIYFAMIINCKLYSYEIAAVMLMKILISI